jgi:hypothetical protein
MRFNKMIYFSRRRLETFFPARPPRCLPTMNVEVDLPVATVGLGLPSKRDPTDAELHRLRQVRRQLEREAAHFYAPGLRTGDWIYFDLEMGWSTSHGDSDLPDLDDVVLFYGSIASEHSPVGISVDLMLCGSTEHLLKKPPLPAGWARERGGCMSSSSRSIIRTLAVTPKSQTI